ncbi:ATP-dependent DNA helicase [Halobacillus sp. MO56]
MDLMMIEGENIMKEMKISVRSLVEYVYRGGNIDNRFRSSSSLMEGTLIHQHIQREYKEQDEKEVFLKTEFKKEGMTIIVHGRCDGLLKTETSVIIDEIKSTSMPLEELTRDSFPVYWAQAKGYAYIYALDHQLDEIKVQLTYVQKTTKEKKRFIQTCSFEELSAFMDETIASYTSYARILAHIREEKHQSISDLKFPFSTYRPGQRKLAGAVYKTIKEERNLFGQAPTGIGKTISTLFPAIKVMGDTDTERLFYLTAKTITRMTAEEALALMEENGLRLRSVTLTAKDKICFQEETICQPEYCEFADGYYDRVNGAILDILRNETQMTRGVIEEYARKHRVCPFEFSLDLAYIVDVVIGDYNYIFDPRVSLKRMVNEDRKQTALLVDEAHNLVERSRGMFSSDLASGAFYDLKELYAGGELSEAVGYVEAAFDTLLADHKIEQNFLLEEVPGMMEEAIDHFVAQAEQELREEPEREQNDLLLETYFEAQNFLKILQLVDDHYVIYGSIEKNNVDLHLFCVDPSYLLNEVSKQYGASVFFSATLSPFPYYKDMLGGKKEDYILQLGSPYDYNQVDITVQPLSTRYKDREKTSVKLADSLYEMVERVKGNHLFFFPSYHYMELIYSEWLKRNKQGGKFRSIIQSQGMTEQERDDFLGSFQEEDQKLVGFAVLGGVFSEGVDLRGDRLNGVAIVGIGLAPRSMERDLIKDYFNEKGKNGYEYAYVYPGMNKVLQAGGRLIRSEEDHGSILLVDDRFLTNKYLSLFPPEWSHYVVNK